MKLACSRFIPLTNTSSVHIRQTGSQEGFLQPLKGTDKVKNSGLCMPKALAIPNSQQIPDFFLVLGSGMGTSPLATLRCDLPVLGSAEGKLNHGFYNHSENTAA